MRNSSINKLNISFAQITDFIVLSIFILFVSANSTISESERSVVLFFSYLLFLFIKRKHKLDKNFILLLGIWVIINVLSRLIPNPNTPFTIITFLGVTLRLIIPYFIIKILGKYTFEKLFTYIYILTIISIVLFSIQLIYPSLFYSVSSALNFITREEQVKAGGWYIFIYMFSGWAADRNCGFMWEPGGFAAILTFALVFQLVKNKYQIDKKVLVFTIALLTTFSTAGYLALFFIIILFFIQRREKIYNPLYWIMLLSLIVIAPNFYNESDFMKEKLDEYIERGVDTSVRESGLIRVSRLGITLVVLDYSTVWPFGNGVLTNEYKVQKYGDVHGPNSLAQILHEWGWIGLILFFSLFYKYYYYYSKSNLVTVLILISISIVLFSNPFHFKYFIYAMIFYSLIYLAKNNRHFVWNK